MSHLGTQDQCVANGSPTQIEIAVFHTQFVAAIAFVFNGERWSVSRIQNIQGSHFQFNFAGWDVFVLAAAFADRSGCLNHILPAKLTSHFGHRLLCFFVENQLGNAITVAKINEGHPAQVTYALNPACKGYHRTLIVDAQFAACMCSVHICICLVCLQK